MGKFVDGVAAGVERFFSGIPHSETTHKQMQPPPFKPRTVTHVVRRGESLSSIAGKYKDVTYQEIARANGIANPNTIYPGQRLTIPNQAPIPNTPNAPKPNPNIKPVPDATSTGKGDKDGCKCKPPKWMRIAKKEIGTKEIHGKEHNPRVLEYHSVSGGFSTDEVPWCGSFINWVMKQAGYKTVSFPARAKSWKNFEKKPKSQFTVRLQSRAGKEEAMSLWSSDNQKMGNICMFWAAINMMLST